MFVVKSFGLSVRRACKLIGLVSSSMHYKAAKKDDSMIRNRLKELAEERKRFGYRRLHILLRREGLVINHKHTERLYKEEKLALSKRRRRKKVAAATRLEHPAADRINQV